MRQKHLPISNIARYICLYCSRRNWSKKPSHKSVQRNKDAFSNTAMGAVVKTHESYRLMARLAKNAIRSFRQCFRKQSCHYLIDEGGDRRNAIMEKARSPQEREQNLRLSVLLPKQINICSHLHASALRIQQHLLLFNDESSIIKLLFQQSYY